MTLEQPHCVLIDDLQRDRENAYRFMNLCASACSRSVTLFDRARESPLPTTITVMQVLPDSHPKELIGLLITPLCFIYREGPDMSR